MRSSRSIVLAVASVLAMAAVLSGCQSAPGTPAAPANGAAAAAGTAAQAHSRLLEAFNNCNETAFVGAFAPIFSLASSNTKQAVTSREGLQRYLAAGCVSRPNPTATLVQQTTKVSGAITVFSGQYRYRVPAAGGQGVELMQNFTTVFERLGDRWLVLAQHLSVAP
jgi:hypothetical protein